MCRVASLSHVHGPQGFIQRHSFRHRVCDNACIRASQSQQIAARSDAQNVRKGVLDRLLWVLEDTQSAQPLCTCACKCTRNTAPRTSTCACLPGCTEPCMPCARLDHDEGGLPAHVHRPCWRPTWMGYRPLMKDTRVGVQMAFTSETRTMHSRVCENNSSPRPKHPHPSPICRLGGL